MMGDVACSQVVLSYKDADVATGSACTTGFTRSNVFSFYRLIKLRFIAVKIKCYVIKITASGQHERKVAA